MKKIQPKQINWAKVLLFLWNERLFIVYGFIISIIVGIAFAFSLEEQYTSRSLFVPQVSQNSRNSSLGNLASIAGMNLNTQMGTSDIPPGLYPRIVSSVAFKKQLVNAKVTFIQEDGKRLELTYSEFYEKYYSSPVIGKIKKYTIGLPKMIWRKIRGESDSKVESVKGLEDTGSMIYLTQDEINHFERLNGQLKVEPNEKQGYVQLSMEMPFPLMAAQMALAAEDLLQKEIIRYKIQTASEQLKFTESRFAEKKNEFNEIQQKLANFRDKNQNITSSLVRNQLDNLQAEYSFALDNYNEIARQMENAKLQVSKDTPVFSVIDPVVVPNKRSAPNKPLILILSIILGMVVVTGVISTKYLISDVKELIRSQG